MSSKDKTYRRLITSPEWRRLRAMKIQKSPLCEDCLLEGRTTPATEVHHVYPVERGHSVREMEILAFDYNNLRSLCHKCHQNAHISMNSRSKSAIKASNEMKKKRFIKKYLRD